jgi:hypothetical protein
MKRKWRLEVMIGADEWTDIIILGDPSPEHDDAVGVIAQRLEDQLDDARFWSSTPSRDAYRALSYLDKCVSSD